MSMQALQKICRTLRIHLSCSTVLHINTLPKYYHPFNFHYMQPIILCNILRFCNFFIFFICNTCNIYIYFLALISHIHIVIMYYVFMPKQNKLIIIITYTFLKTWQKRSRFSPPLFLPPPTYISFATLLCNCYFQILLDYLLLYHFLQRCIQNHLKRITAAMYYTRQLAKCR